MTDGFDVILETVNIYQVKRKQMFTDLYIQRPEILNKSTNHRN